MLCGRQNPSSRGHGDDTKYLKEANPSSTGNFQALLSFMIENGDKLMEDHSQTAQQTVTY